MIFAILCRQSLLNYRQGVEHAYEQFGDTRMKQKASILVPENLHLDCAVMSYKDRRVGYQRENVTETHLMQSSGAGFSSTEF